MKRIRGKYEIKEWLSLNHLCKSLGISLNRYVKQHINVVFFAD